HLPTAVRTAEHALRNRRTALELALPSLLDGAAYDRNPRRERRHQRGGLPRRDVERALRLPRDHRGGDVLDRAQQTARTAEGVEGEGEFSGVSQNGTVVATVPFLIQKDCFGLTPLQ